MVVMYSEHVEVAVDTLKRVAFVTRRHVCSLLIYQIHPNVTVVRLIFWTLPVTKHVLPTYNKIAIVSRVYNLVEIFPGTIAFLLVPTYY